MWKPLLPGQIIQWTGTCDGYRGTIQSGPDDDGFYTIKDHDTGAEAFGTYFDPADGKFSDSAIVPVPSQGPVMVSYRHRNGDNSIRFKQFEADPLPPWATEVRIHVD